MLLRKIWLAFFHIFNWHKIPPLPRGMLASKYEDVNVEERRVMARLGSRDFAGVRRAMRQHGVDTIEELVDRLEHHRPERNIGYRLKLAIGRVVGGHEVDPHRAEIMIAMRHNEKTAARAEVEHRLKYVRSKLK